MNASTDPYKILQVDSEAEDEVIQAAYRRLAQKYHPDVAGPDGAARMAAINAAWELLRDPARRAAFDTGRLPPASASPRPMEPARTSPPRAESGPPAPAPPSAGQGKPETVSADWTSGRSSSGSGYDPARMREPDGEGAAGPPPGNPSGPVLRFGRFSGWSIGEVARRDIDYLEWLDRMPIGRPYREEIDGHLRKAGRRRSAGTESQDRRGLFRRR
ncbi:MAG TPA: J domain-containing protein [Candidatus Limnocylindrales bacterium]|jgi:molecular chaperone DnaJ|nr:J domain-containing protein [Candidatus Limnocylindrales bacterium]